MKDLDLDRKQPVPPVEETPLENALNSIAALADTWAVIMERKAVRDGLLIPEEVSEIPDDVQL